MKPQVHFNRSLCGRIHDRLQEISRISPRPRPAKAYLNWIRSNYELWKGASTVHARPLKLTFDPANVCQLRCPLCPTGLRILDRPAGCADLELFQSVLNEVGDYVFFLDLFNWGEPLLNPHLEEFIRRACARDIVCSVSTNLSLPLTNERIEALVRSGLHYLVVSLDGASEETYATYRRRGNFNLVCSNLRKIIAARQRLEVRTPFITWQFLVFQFNQHEVDKACRMAADLGVDRIVFSAPCLQVDRFPLSSADRQEIARWAPTLPALRASHATGESHRRKRCGWHYMSSAINWEGSVASCCTTFALRDDFSTLGKTGERSYMEAVNAEAFRQVREYFSGVRPGPIERICEQCPQPDLMDYHKFLNRQVVLHTAVEVFQAFTNWLSGTRQHKRAAADYAEATPVHATLPNEPRILEP